MARLSPEEEFELLRDRVSKTVDGLFPIVGKRHTLELKGVEVKDNLHIDDIESQKKAKVGGRSWTVPVEATVRLKDNTTGKKLDEQKLRLLNLPKTTRRFTHIVDGQEYQIDNQWRLKSGIYARVKDNGELQSQFNLAKGRGFNLGFDPRSRAFTMQYGNSNIPLQPLMRELGVGHEEIEKRWGKQISSSQDQDTEKALRKFYKASTGKQPESLEEAREHLWKTFQETELRPDVTKTTLGKEHSKVTGSALFDAATKLLHISQGKAEPDPRDALHFKELHSSEDFFSERLQKGTSDIMRRVQNTLDRKESVRDIIGPDTFNRPVKMMYRTSLANVPDQTNPLEMVSGQMKTTITGEGGIKSAHGISEDAKLIDPSHLGFLDPIHTPEGKCYSADMEVYTKTGWKHWPDVVESDELACRIDGRLEFHNPIELIAQPYHGKMYGVDTKSRKRRLKYLVTPNHRIFSRTHDVRGGGGGWRFEPAEFVHERTRVLATAHDAYLGENKEWFNLPHVEGNNSSKNVVSISMLYWAELVGWVLSEGGAVFQEETSCYSVTINQSTTENPHNCKLIESCLSRLSFAWSRQLREDGKATYFVSTKQLASYFSQFGISHEKFIPEYFFDCSVEVRETLLDVLLRGDGRIGSHRKDGSSYKQQVYCTTSVQLAKDVERLAISLGYGTKISRYSDEREERYRDVYEIRLHRHKERMITWRKDHFYTEHYDAMVYCATVPGGLLYVRKGEGIAHWSGNSTGVSLRIPMGVRKVGNSVVIPVYDTKRNRSVRITPEEAVKSNVVLPDQVRWEGGRPVPIGKTVRMSGTGNELVDGSMKDARYVMKDPIQMFSMASNLVPFVASDHPNRSTMAGRHMEQAISLKNREAPLVQSLAGSRSFEELMGQFSGHVAPTDGQITQVKGNTITIKGSDGKVNKVQLYDHFPLNADKGFLHSTPTVKVGDKVKKGQVVADTNFSVSGKEEVFVRQGGHAFRIRLEELKHLPGTEVLALNCSEVSYAWRPLLEVIKHRTEDPLVEIQTRCGRSMRVTASHSCLTTNNDGDIIKIRPSDMVPGRTLVPVAGHIPGVEHFWDLIPFAPQTREAKNATRHVYAGFDATWELGFVLGMYLAEGDLPHQKYVRFGVTEPRVREALLRCLSYLDLPYTETDTTVVVGCRQLSEAIASTFGHGATNKFLPGWVYTAPSYFRNGMVDGFWSGDGSVYPDPDGIRASAQTDSEALAVGVQDLLTGLGIQCRRSAYHRKYPEYENANEWHYRLYISATSVGQLPALSHPEKERNRRLWEPPKHDQLSVAPVPDRLVNGKLRGKGKRGYVGLTFARREASNERYQQLLDGDVLWDVVEEIREVEPEEWVYDLSVGDDETFVLASGLTVHNTKGGQLALGTNLRTAYMPFKGYNFEDGVVISESAANKLSSEHLHRKSVARDKGYVLSKKKFQAYSPDSLNRDQSEKLDDEGVVKPGMKIMPGDTLIAALRERTERAEDREIAKIHKSLVRPYTDASVKWESDYPGEVKEVIKQGKKVAVHIKTTEPMEIGDKLAGRHGNKGIVTKIIPDHEMPRTKSGSNIDILMNPTGVPGRTNLGQILETAAGKIAEKTGKPYKVKNFQPGSDLHSQITEELKRHGIEDKEEIVDPETGRTLGRALVGPQHIIKLKHQVEKKMRARAGGPGYAYDRNFIPKGGGPHGAQALGTLGLYSMLAHGAKENLREMQTLKSDASQSDEFWAALQAGETLPAPRPTFAYKKFTSYLNGLGLNVKKEGNNLQLIPLTDQQIKEMSNGEIKDAGKMVKAKNLEPERGGLFDPKVTGGVEGTKWSHMKLPEPMPNPIFEGAIQSLTGMTGKDFNAVMQGQRALDPKTGNLTTDLDSGLVGGKAIGHMLSGIDIEKALADAQKEIQNPNLKGNRLDKVNKRIKYLKALGKSGLTPKDAYMTSLVPVMPPSMRPFSQLPNGDLNFDDLNGLYKGLSVSASRLKQMSPLLPEEEKAEIRSEVYDGLKALAGLGGHMNREYRGITDVIAGKRPERAGGRGTGKKFGSPKEGFFQNKLIQRKQDLSMRSTIIPEPALGLDEVGIPRQAALELYKPFVVRELRGLTGMSPLAAQKQIKDGGEVVNRALDRVVEQRPLLLKRDPALHKYNVQAFKPRIVGGKAVQIHPLVTSGFNADFDGDTMAAFVPVGMKAVDEARKMYPSRNLFSPSTGDLMYSPTLEAQLGLYGASQPPAGKSKASFNNMKDVESALRKGSVTMDDTVKVGGITSTVGRFQIAGALPEDMRKSFLSSKTPLDKKGQKTLLTQVAKSHRNDYGEVVNKLKDIGNEWGTQRAFSLGMEDIAPEKKLRDDVLKAADRLAAGKTDAQRIQIYDKATQALHAQLGKVTERDSNLIMMNKSGIKPFTDTLRQIKMAPMLIANAKGETIPHPVKKSYAEGLDLADYWTSMSGARKGIIQKVQSVQEPGYVSKQVMNSVMDNIVLDDDCGTDKGIALSIDEKDVLDRHLAVDHKAGSKTFRAGTLITPEVRNSLRNNKVNRVTVRSPLRCQHGPGVCKKSMLPETVVTVRAGEQVLNLSLEKLFEVVPSPVVREDAVEIKYPSGWEIRDGGEWVQLERVVRHPREADKKILEIRTTHGRAQHVTEDHTSVVHRPRACTCGSLRISVDNRSPDNRAYLYCRDCKRSWTVNRTEWEFAEELEIRSDQVLPGDRIVYDPMPVPDVVIDTQLDPYWLGVYLAEGSTDRHSRHPRQVTIAQADHRWRPAILEACYRVTENTVSCDDTKITISDVKLIDKLRIVLGQFELCDRKVLPATWLEWGGSYVGSVVAGLLDGDGSARERSNGSHEILLGSTSYTLLVQVQDWLARYDVRADLSCKTQPPKGEIKTRRDFYHLTFSANEVVLQLLGQSQKLKGLRACSGKYDLTKRYATVLQVKDVSHKVHCTWVYDVTTQSRRFTANGLRTHNCYGLTEDGVAPEVGLNVGVLAGQALGERATQLSMKAFHCNHAQSIVFCRQEDRKVVAITMEDLFHQVEVPVELVGDEEIKVVDGWEIYDGGWVQLTHVRRHAPSRPMMAVGDRGLITICQDNHPIAVWQNDGVCSACGHHRVKAHPNGRRGTCPECRHVQDFPEQHIGAAGFLPPSEIDPKRYYLDRDLTVLSSAHATSRFDFNPYVVGMYLAEGCINRRWTTRRKRHVKKPYSIDVAQNAGEIRDQLVAQLEQEGVKVAPSKKRVLIHDLELGKLFDSAFGGYAHEKRLPPDFVQYPLPWLREMLAGLIDGDGTVEQHKDGPDMIGVDTTSFALAQQMVIVCALLNIPAGMVLTTNRKLTRHQGFKVRIKMTNDAQDALSNSVKVRGIERGTYDQGFEFSGKRLVGVVREVLYTDDYVYDATTETGTLFVSGLKSHNTGGTAASKTEIVDEFDRVKQLLRFPKTLPGAATLAQTGGVVEKIQKDPAGGHNVFIGGERHYVPRDRGMPTYGGRQLKKGMQVRKGAAISTGPVNPHEMLPLTGVEPVQGYLSGELHKIYGSHGIRRRNTEMVVKSLTNLTKIDDPGDHSDFIRGDFAPQTQVANLNRKLPNGARPIRHVPVLKGVDVLPLDMQEDWMARMNHERIESTVIGAAQQGWTSKIHGKHPIPSMAYGAEVGKGVKPWEY